MYDLTLHRGRIYLTRHICRYCLQAFSTAEILKNHVNDSFKSNAKEMIKMSKRKHALDSKIMKGI